MAGNLFNRYLWLINLLMKEGPIPFAEISSRWARSTYNPVPGQELPRKTFQNHCNAISDIFGVDVKCEKGGDYGYSISRLAYSEQWKGELLSDLLIVSAVKDDSSLSANIVNYDQSDQERLGMVIDHILKRHLISFVRPLSHIEAPDMPLSSSKTYSLKSRKTYRLKRGTSYNGFLPLGLLRMEFKWYCVGVFPKNGRISPFLLKCMENIEYEKKYLGDEYADFKVSDYVDKFHYDESDTFKDARPYLERDIHRHRGRKKYGVGIIPQNEKPLPW